MMKLAIVNHSLFLSYSYMKHSCLTNVQEYENVWISSQTRNNKAFITHNS
jgi:hypothetical protein